MASCIARQFAQLSVSQPRSSAPGRVGCVPPLSSRPFLRRPSGPAPGRQGLWVVGARVANVEIPNSKCIEYSLQYIYGIGPTLAKNVLEKAGVDRTVRTHALSEEQLQRIRDEVDGCLVEGDLRRMVALNIKRLKEIQSYRGRRHYMNLPVRGQRSKTNARTRKGKAKTVAGKKK